MASSAGSSTLMGSSTEDLESRSKMDLAVFGDNGSRVMTIVKDISWDSDIIDIAHHPKNMPKTKKILITAVNCSMALITMMSVSLMTPAVSKIVKEFNTTLEIGALTYSVYVMGWALAPMILCPLSELYGRRWFYIGCWGLFIAGFVACALAPNMACLLVFRFLAGLGGSPAVALNAGTLTDIWDADQRGTAIGMVVIVSYLGPVCAPIIGGYITQNISWEWTLWITAIMGFAIFPFVLWTPETHAPTILAQQVRREQRKSGNMHLRAEGRQSVSMSILRTAIEKPFQLLFTEPIVFFVSLYISILTGILYLYFGAYPFVFQRIYKLSVGDASLAFLGVAVGCLIAVPSVSMMTKLYKKRKENNNGCPEDCLPWTLWAAVVLPIGPFIFAWTSKQEIHYIVPIVGGIPFGWSSLVLIVAFYTYLAEAYESRHAGSIFAGILFVRSIVTAGFPVAMPKMYGNLGVAWASSLLGFLLIACVPIPFYFARYGKKLRERSPFAATQ